MRTLRFLNPSIVYPLLGLMAVSCGSKREASENAVAKAEIAGYQPNTQGGTLLFTDQGSEGTRIHGEIVGLLPDKEYAMHIHERGDCSSPEASGAHFDPLHSNVHGEPGSSPGQRHAGDLPNFSTDEDGRALVDISSHLLGTGTSEFSLVGKSVVIHASKDDYRTQPSGGSGPKIACGVIQGTSG